MRKSVLKNDIGYDVESYRYQAYLNGESMDNYLYSIYNEGECEKTDYYDE